MPRTAFVSAAVALAFEHHHAVAHLVESSHFASAGALVRPTLDSVTTAIWGLYVADHAIIEELFLTNRPIPKPRAMLSAIEGRPELRNRLGLKALMDGPGRFFHGLTHGEMVQLRRRYGTMESTFSERENEGTLAIVDLFALLGASLLARATQRNVDHFLAPQTDGLVDEIRQKTGLPLTEWTGWKPMPEPTIFPGYIPDALKENA